MPACRIVGDGDCEDRWQTTFYSIGTSVDGVSYKTPPKAPILAQLKKQNAIIRRRKIRNQNAGWILQPHAERASCLHYMARSRRQGCAPCTRRLHLDRVRSAIGWHLGITLGVCMSVVLQFYLTFKMSLDYRRGSSRK